MLLEIQYKSSFPNLEFLQPNPSLTEIIGPQYLLSVHFPPASLLLKRETKTILSEEKWFFLFPLMKGILNYLFNMAQWGLKMAQKNCN